MPNLNQPEFDDVREQPGFNARRARLGRQAGAQRLGLSYWEIEPGQAAYPYHVHLTEEELLVVLEGRPRLRTPEGWRELEPGEVVSFTAGERGAHQLVNGTDETVRFIAISTAGAPEILLQPDSGKLGARDAGSLTTKWFRESEDVPYFDGEQPPDA
ncbi:MAG TPA: cupin domain-containing protein [Thermoleophilaceae bacterium]|nr:cupin domain-containing protein [Thermoleophilaceae bacterium]